MYARIMVRDGSTDGKDRGARKLGVGLAPLPKGSMPKFKTVPSSFS